jgi:2-oxoisovalerate dehydrogenase E1 component alpha subunit
MRGGGGVLAQAVNSKAAAVKAQILKSFSAAEKRKKPSIEELFNDVYDKMPFHLTEQKKQLDRLCQDYPQHFNTEKHVK